MDDDVWSGCKHCGAEHIYGCRNDDSCYTIAGVDAVVPRAEIGSRVLTCDCPCHDG